MFQVGTANNNNNQVHPNIVMPSILATLHPNNSNHPNPKIISRSPSALLTQDQRSLSPNKLNATKKPMIGVNNQNTNKNVSNNITNFIGRNRNAASPSPKNNNQHTNFQQNYGTHQYNSNNPSNYNNPFHNFSSNNPRQPLLNSNGYGRPPNDLAVFNLQNNFDKTRYCMNHQNKLAQFTTEIDSQQLGYCQKCAINLASRGFSVSRKGQVNPSKPNFQQTKDYHTQKKKFQPFYHPQYMGVIGYAQIQKIVSNLDSIYADYTNQIYKYQTIQQHFKHQIVITQKFYQSLINTVNQMKEDHLADLETEAKKHYQLALIKEDNLKQDVQQMETIRKDLTQNLQAIFSDFNKGVVQEVLSVYKQKIYTYQDKIQQQCNDFSKQIINQNQPELQRRLQSIQKYLLDVWDDKKLQNNTSTNANPPQKPQRKKSTQDKSPKAVKNIINLNGKADQQNNKQKQHSACRRLFDDDNPDFEAEQNSSKRVPLGYPSQRAHRIPQDIVGQTSPQFKNI